MKWQIFLLETTKQGNDEQAKKSDKVLRESRKKTNQNAREKGSNTCINVKHSMLKCAEHISNCCLRIFFIYIHMYATSANECVTDETQRKYLHSSLQSFNISSAQQPMYACFPLEYLAKMKFVAFFFFCTENAHNISYKYSCIC